MKTKTLTDLEIAKNIRKSTFSRCQPKNLIRLESEVINGIRYLTFSVNQAEKTHPYPMLTMLADFLGLSNRKETFANSHFMEHWYAVRNYAIKQLELDKRIPVCISGHGIAGAIAIIAGYDLMRLHQYNILKVVTFGAPRSLNKMKTNDHFLYLLHVVSTNYVLPNDKLPKMFRFTRYYNIKPNKVVLKDKCLSAVEYDDYSSIDSYIKCLAVETK